jgi:hypothetical protein
METRTVKERIVEMLQDAARTKAELLAQFDSDRQARGAASVVAYLIRSGQVEVDADGRHRLTGRAPIKVTPAPKRKPLPAPAPWPVRSEPEPEPAPVASPEPAQPPLKWALWHDGDLLIRRGEMTIVLTDAERTRISDWLGRVAA